MVVKRNRNAEEGAYSKSFTSLAAGHCFSSAKPTDPTRTLFGLG